MLDLLGPLQAQCCESLQPVLQWPCLRATNSRQCLPSYSRICSVSFHRSDGTFSFLSGPLPFTLSTGIPWVAGSLGCKVHHPSPPLQPWCMSALVMPTLSQYLCTPVLKPEARLPHSTSDIWTLGSTWWEVMSSSCENFRGTTQIVDRVSVSSLFPQRITLVGWTPKTHKI